MIKVSLAIIFRVIGVPATCQFGSWNVEMVMVDIQNAIDTLDKPRRDILKNLNDEQKIVIDEFLRLPKEQRRQIFVRFCRECGSDNPSCICWSMG